MNKLFVVEALRWGDREDHTYVVGVFDNLQDACEACIVEEMWRDGKYECFINDCNEMNIEIQEQKKTLFDEWDVEEFNLEVQKRVEAFLEEY
jgi:hypothetical protein